MNDHAVLARFTALIIALSLCAQTAHAGELSRVTSALPDVAAPPAGTAMWVARSMRLNGVPMTIKSFASQTNADEVLRHYERQLRMLSGAKTRRTQEDSWEVLAVLASDSYITVRARNTGHGAEGTIAVTPPLAHLKASHRTRFPHPYGARVVNLQQYDDEGMEAEHISFVTPQAIGTAARAFADALARDGWEILRGERGDTAAHGEIIEAQKGAALAFINVQRAPGAGATSVTVVWRKA